MQQKVISLKRKLIPDLDTSETIRTAFRFCGRKMAEFRVRLKQRYFFSNLHKMICYFQFLTNFYRVWIQWKEYLAFGSLKERKKIMHLFCMKSWFFTNITSKIFCLTLWSIFNSIYATNNLNTWKCPCLGDMFYDFKVQLFIWLH